jgi:hypothetical protein
MQYSQQDRLARLVVSTALFLVPIVGAAGVAQAQAKTPRVALVPPKFVDTVPKGPREAIAQRFELGMKATGVQPVGGAQVTAALPADGAKCDKACRAALAAKLSCDFVAGARIEGEDRFFKYVLWLADRTGKRIAKVKKKCDICGAKAAADAMELAASALATKMRATPPDPATVSISSDPQGARIEIDGKYYGETPRDVKLGAGKHEIVLKLKGHISATKTLTCVASVAEKVALKLIRKAVKTKSNRKLWGWLAVGAGVGAAIAGIAMLAVDGSGTDCVNSAHVSSERCRETTSSATGGGVLLGVGAVAIGTGLYFLLTGESKKEKSPTLTLTPAGISMQGTF